jgi:hypothetical protein
MVRECVSSHSPHHGTVGGCRSCSCGRSFRRRASTRTGSLTGLGFWIRWSVSSAAGHPCAKADSTAACRLRASRMLSVHASVTASKIRAAASLGSDGDSIDGFKGSRCGTPGGSQIGTGGSRIGTVRKMWRQGVIQVVACRALRPGVVELWTATDEATRFQVFECAQDRASPGIGLSHQGTGRGIAREILIRLIR